MSVWNSLDIRPSKPYRIGYDNMSTSKESRDWRTLTLTYVIHLNAPIIEGFGIAYPVYRTSEINIRPATVCAGAGSPKAAATARNHAFITSAMVKTNRKKVLQ